MGLKKKCSVEGCPKEECKKGMCRRHYNQILIYGKLIGNPSNNYRDLNLFEEKDDYVRVFTNDVWGNINNSFILDKKDWEKLKKHKWNIDRLGYPSTCIDGKNKRLHVLLCGYEVTDHINQNKQDNRRSNLRECSNTQNRANVKRRKDNKTGYKGVFLRSNGTYIACVRKEGKQYHLGTFKKDIDAARAYNEAAIVLFGEFACLNLIPKKERRVK